MQPIAPLRIPRTHLPEMARVRRKGWADAVLAIAKCEGDFLVIELADFSRLTVEYADHGWRLGDAVAKVAKPAGRLIDRVTAKLPKRFHTHFGVGCTPCAQRQAALNAAGQSFWALLRWRFTR